MKYFITEDSPIWLIGTECYYSYDIDTLSPHVYFPQIDLAIKIDANNLGKVAEKFKEEINE